MHTWPYLQALQGPHNTHRGSKEDGLRLQSTLLTLLLGLQLIGSTSLKCGLFVSCKTGAVSPPCRTELSDRHGYTLTWRVFLNSGAVDPGILTKTLMCKLCSYCWPFFPPLTSGLHVSSWFSLTNPHHSFYSLPLHYWTDTNMKSAFNNPEKAFLWKLSEWPQNHFQEAVVIHFQHSSNGNFELNSPIESRELGEISVQNYQDHN